MAKDKTGKKKGKKRKDKNPSRAVAAREEKGGAIAAPGDFNQYAGQGMDTVTANDLLIPRLLIAQKLSPQLKKRDPQFIKGAKEGDICDAALGLNFDEVDFLPVIFRKKWIEWAPRSSKKGIINIYDDNRILAACTVDERGRTKHGENLVVETAQFYGFRCMDDGDMVQSFIAMAATQLKKARRWMSMATSKKLTRPDGSKFTAPLWYTVYNLNGSSEENNDEGDWRGWVIEPDLPILEWCEKAGLKFEEIRPEIIGFHDAVAAGTITNFTPSDTTVQDGGEVPF